MDLGSDFGQEVASEAGTSRSADSRNRHGGGSTRHTTPPPPAQGSALAAARPYRQPSSQQQQRPSGPPSVQSGDVAATPGPGGGSMRPAQQQQQSMYYAAPARLQPAQGNEVPPHQRHQLPPDDAAGDVVMGHQHAGLNDSHPRIPTDPLEGAAHVPPPEADPAPGRAPVGQGMGDVDMGADRPQLDYSDWIQEYEEAPASVQAREFLETPANVFVRVVEVRNLPLSIGVSEVTIAFAEPRGRALVVLPELPSKRKMQDEGSECVSPVFTACSLSASTRPKVQVTVTLTCIDHRTRYCGVLGHCVLPIWNKRGTFEVRLREGKMNDLSGITGPWGPDTSIYLPLTSVVLELNMPPGGGGAPSSGGPVNTSSSSTKYFDFTHNEELLVADRHGKTAATMRTYNIGPINAQKMFDAFHQQETAGPRGPTNTSGVVVPTSKQPMGAGGQQQQPGAKMRPLDVSFYAPYNEKRGAAIVLHSLYYCLSPDRTPFQLFKVVLDVDGRRAFTRTHDWQADPFRPRYQGAHFVFPEVRMRQNAACVLRVYRLKFVPRAAALEDETTVDDDEEEEVDYTSDSPAHPKAPPRKPRKPLRELGSWHVEEYGWGAIGLASPLGKDILRHAPTTLVRLYQGRVPESLGNVLTKSDSVEAALGRLTESGDIQLHRKTVGNQSPIISLSVADPARLDEVVAERRGSTLVPEKALHQAFKKVWPKPSEIQADSNAFFKATVFGM